MESEIDYLSLRMPSFRMRSSVCVCVCVSLSLSSVPMEGGGIGALLRVACGLRLGFAARTRPATRMHAFDHTLVDHMVPIAISSEYDFYFTSFDPTSVVYNHVVPMVSNCFEDDDPVPVKLFMEAVLQYSRVRECVYVCVCVCIYIYIYIYVCVCVCVCGCVCVYVCVWLWICLSVPVCYLSDCASVDLFVCVCMLSLSSLP
jgi:hypothetical protein